jgi:Protein of unknown function (DUF2911)
MRRPIIMTAVLVALALAGGSLYIYFRPLSPGGHAKLTIADLTVYVSYSRPSVRERLIFGTAEQGALVPYDVYWRLGANAATEIKFSRDVLFNGQPVKAGSYRMYAIPGPETFEIALNSELGKSGAEEPNYKLDVLHTQVPVEKLETPIEKFTIHMVAAGKSINIIFEWSEARFIIPVKPR